MDQSEEEIFLGKPFANVKEIRATLNRLTFSQSGTEADKLNSSFKIIETRSEPNLIRDDHYEDKEGSTVNSMKPTASVRPVTQKKSVKSLQDLRISKISDESFNLMEQKIASDIIAETVHTNSETETDTLEFLNKTSEITKKNLHQILTPVKSNKNDDKLFKTPGKPMSAVKRTPVKDATSSNYKNICSPVAYYIKNSPQPTLIQNIKPKKPLPAPSSIPKLLAANSNKKGKENVELPQRAYIRAKETKLVEQAQNKKLPTSRQVAKVASSLPQPIIIRHEKREVANPTPAKRPNQSFGNITLSQADVSVCTVETTCFKK